jgi:hypothetical protein
LAERAGEVADELYAREVALATTPERNVAVVVVGSSSAASHIEETAVAAGRIVEIEVISVCHWMGLAHRTSRPRPF